MSAHAWTPGPWSVDSDGYIDADGGICIAQIFRYGAGRPGPFNARLIAQAPAMYEALERLVDAVDPESTGWSQAVDVLSAARGDSHG